MNCFGFVDCFGFDEGDCTRLRVRKCVFPDCEFYKSREAYHTDRRLAKEHVFELPEGNYYIEKYQIKL